MTAATHEDSIRFQQQGIRMIWVMNAVARLGFAAYLGFLTFPGGVLAVGFALLSGSLALLVRVLPLQVSIFLVGGELTAFALVMDLIFGWQAGFDVQMLYIVFAVFIFEALPTWVRAIMAALPLVGMAVVVLLLPSVEPIVNLTEAQQVGFRVGNTLYSALVTLGLMIHFGLRLHEQKARAQRQAEARHRLVTALSHELKTPIAAMLTRTQVALQKQKNSDADSALLHLLERNLQSMGRLVRRMLELSGLEYDDRSSGLESLDLKSLIEGCVEENHLPAEAKQIRWNVSCEPGLSIVTHPVLLRLALNNLVSNAIRYSTESGTIAITAVGSGSSVCLNVQDEGIGIDPDDLPHIFEPFYRGDRARSRQEGSHGLGLSLAKDAVDRLGGRLDVESAPGVGSSFTIRL